MWDSGFMADIENFTNINENFDTIKTLLNSIRAQGILNTSDVDKLLSGINSKLEKINTEEDIDLIKVFLTELKQNLDERHNVLVSKFGAIEALFSNLLKNSNELPKSSDVKEYFDIVATNLSVFSREVVAQKESLTDITMRLDAIRSDDSQKKDIIKNIAPLKSDLELLNNGFNSIVISLNDNFKTLAKTISSIDQTEHLNKFSEDLNSIEMSSNTILSALQLLNKKTEAVDESVKKLATKSDLEETGKNIAELQYINRNIDNKLTEISGRYTTIDNLADKIDASVNIIAGLKSVLETSDNQNTSSIMARIDALGDKITEISNDTEFEEFKTSLTGALREISEGTSLLDKNLNTASENVNSISELLRAIDINSNFSSVLSAIETSDSALKEHLDNKFQAYATIGESNLGRIIDNITSSANSLTSKIGQTQSEITSICEGNFDSVFENISELKKIVGQLDENTVSANNAMFSNISDRLNLFETVLKESLESQELTTNDASAKLTEQVENIKNLSNVLDYKMDSSVVEISNMTRMFETLKTSVDGVLALNFVETVKDLRADIYASKQDITIALENSGTTLTENISNDLYGKYELLISKLDAVEDEFKQTQTSALTYIKDMMEKISDSIVDVISYVSESKEYPTDELDSKIDKISEILKETNLNYVENVRDAVDIIRIQVENNLKALEDDTVKRFDYVNRTLENNSENLHTDIKNSYNKILEIQKLYDELKALINTNDANNGTKIETLALNVSDLNGELENKISALKSALLDKVSEFKNEFTCDYANKINEFKFTVESLYSKNSQEVTDALDSLKVKLDNFETDNTTERASALENIKSSINELGSMLSTSSDENTAQRTAALKEIREGINNLSSLISASSGENTAQRSAALEEIRNGINGLSSLISASSSDSIIQMASELEDVKNNLNKLSSMVSASVSDNSAQRSAALDDIKSNLNDLGSLISASSSDNSDQRAAALESINSSINDLSSLISEFSNDNSKQRTAVLEDIKNDLNGLSSLISSYSAENSEKRSAALEHIENNFNGIKTCIRNLSIETSEGRKNGVEKLTEEIASIREQLTTFAETSNAAESNTVSTINSIYEDLKEKIEKSADENSGARTNALAKLLENFVGIREYVQMLNTKASEELTQKTNNLLESLESVKSILHKVDENVDGDMTRQLSIIESNFESLISQMTILNEKAEQSLVEMINDEYKNISEKIDSNVSQKLEEYKSIIEASFDNLSEKAKTQSAYLQERISDINSMLKSVWESQSEQNIKQLEEISINLKDIIERNIELTSVDYTALRERLDEFTKDLNSNNSTLIQNLKAQLDEMTKYVDSVIDIQTQESDAHIDELVKLIENLSEISKKSDDKLTELDTQISYNAGQTRSKIDDLKAEIEEKQAEFTKLVEALSGSIENKSEKTQSMISELMEKADDNKATLTMISDTIANKSSDTQGLISDLSQLVQENTDNINKITAESSSAELKAIEEAADKLYEQLELEKQTILSIKTFISDTLQDKLKAIPEEIEKETDVIVNELTEQFENVRKSQQDTAIQITTGIESIIESQIYNNIEDLKSYLDIKTDNSVLTDKLDNLKLDITSSLESVITDMNKMLQADVFTSAIADYRVANEILINSATDRINEKIANFIADSVTGLSDNINNEAKNIENKLALFDKKFVDTVVDKYEEIKLISNKYNSSFDEIEKSINDLFDDFRGVRSDIDAKIEQLAETIKSTSENTNTEIRQLNNCLESLRSQISNKSFDEAFQASINKQVNSLEALIKEQFNSIENISEMCGMSFPDIIELNTLVKGSVVETLRNITEKIKGLDNISNLVVSTSGNLSKQIEAQNIEETVDSVIKNAKSDIITQFLNIFNQISFVTEQEEILDYIQERHDELITVLSHIVTSTSKINAVKDGVSAIDGKINKIKNEINTINEKITNIISSEGDIDYVYSLQDLESDIAKFRVVLKDMKENTAGYGAEFSKLMDSTENVYKLVESVKKELPDKKSFDNLTEDIVSISTRTNKLLLASDESYKTLQDNLHDFKLVIDDLDERTKNFAEESGMNRIDSKLNALNTMIQNGAKTNQVFNEVFEYLAGWVDNAGAQINAISDKVETLDDIGQIKVMLADLKAEAEDNSENVELIEALGNVFDKQAKKISSLEAKLDKIIVENTINNQKNKLDLSPMEDTLNRFLAAIGDKMTSQQEKINSLEAKLEKVADILDEKDTAQLTKKVGGMDRQIAKLNKSIEKIASHVVEK